MTEAEARHTAEMSEERDTQVFHDILIVAVIIALVMLTAAPVLVCVWLNP
jgi:hypothetical protein